MTPQERFKEIKSNINGIGKKTIVQFGTNWNIGISPKNTPTSTKAKIPIATIAATGKISFLMKIAVIIPALLVKLATPPEVPLAKI